MIVIPMAGMSSRFTQAGFTRPKYELDAHGQSLFYWSVKSFERYFNQEEVLFIGRAELSPSRFIADECKKLGLAKYSVVELDKPTQGQGETVHIGMKACERYNRFEPLLIFNIDTIRPGYCFPQHLAQCDGYLETFHGEGENWSFARTSAFNSSVIETTEKKRVSAYCSTGLYYFRQGAFFEEAYEQCVVRNGLDFTREWKEHYIAPLYNHLIKAGKNIHIENIRNEDVIFSGTPSEYEMFCKQTKA